MKGDVLEAEVRLAEAKQRLIRAVNAVRLAKAALNILLREPINHDFSVVDALAYHVFEKSFDVCLDIALKKRPELLEAQKNVIKAEKKLLWRKVIIILWSPFLGITTGLVMIRQWMVA